MSNMIHSSKKKRPKALVMEILCVFLASVVACTSGIAAVFNVQNAPRSVAEPNQKDPKGILSPAVRIPASPVKIPPTVLMEGVIVPGDAARLMRLISEQGLGLGMNVRLNSPGGDVNESYSIGRVLRRYQAVVTHKVCASACVFAYLGGSKRITQQSTDAVLVIHQPEGTARTRSINTTDAQAIMRELRDYTIEMIRLPTFFNVMVDIPFGSPVVLQSQDAIAMNVATELAH